MKAYESRCLIGNWYEERLEREELPPTINERGPVRITIGLYPLLQETNGLIASS
jgi:hypothetical protein